MSELSTHKKRKVDTTPFDRFRTPPKQNLLMLPLMWLLCKIGVNSGRLRINKVRMKGLKPPYLVLGTHHAWADFYVTPLALMPHRANYISELEGFEAFGEFLYRQVGCLGTRKFVNDIALVKNIKKVIDRKGILVLYPEARYANVGTNSKLPESVGKLAKLLNVPVVTINMHGNYLQSPIWNTEIRKDAVLEATLTQAVTQQELDNSTVDELNERIAEYLKYDEYEWQYSNKYAITYNKRAEGLHQVLYRCPECNAEFKTETNGADIYCRCCESRWHITEYGQLERIHANEKPREYSIAVKAEPFSHIPDWYEWQRKCVDIEIDNGKYSLDTTVHIEALPNARNFIDLGEGRLIHDKDGFKLFFKDYGETEKKTLSFPPISMLSVHTEYDYRKWGQCITLSTLDNTYFLFPRGEDFNATKIQFATEHLYELAKAEKNKLKQKNT